jgi:hypothetical protein
MLQLTRSIASLSPADLHVLLADAGLEAAKVKDRIATVQAELNDRFAKSVVKSLADQDKQSGTVNLPLQDGMTVKGVVSKKVDWDSVRLLSIAQSMPWEKVAKLFKIEFSVPEKVYEGISVADEDLKKRLDAARTVTYPAPKITLEKAS